MTINKWGVVWICFLSILFFVQKADAIVFEGDPSQNENHFVWSVMSQLQTPDDPDCPTVALAALVSAGIPADQANEPATLTCYHLGQMKTQMQSEMEGVHIENGQTVTMETSLFTAANWHNVENLYFKHITNGVTDGKIAFSQSIDFMSYDFMNFMMHFGENMDSREGYISLDADTVGGFANYGATLTMYNVPEFDEPAILVDGEEDDKGIVSNITYDKAANTLTFSAKHFTSFEAVEASDVAEKPDILKVKKKRYLNHSGQARIRLTVTGRHFDEDIEVKLGSKEAYKVKRKASYLLTATFKESSLEKMKKKLSLRLINPNNNERKYSKKINISKL